MHTQRRRSHTFTEGTFDEIRIKYDKTQQFLSPDINQHRNANLIRQSSAGSPETRKVDNKSPILQTLRRKFLSQGLY